MLDHSNGALPLYLQVKDIIRKRLNHKIYDVGDILPSELSFQEEFQVSRITVRNAVNELVTEGLLERTRGKGTVVLAKKMDEQIRRTKSFTEEMRELGLTAVTRNVSVAVVQADAVIGAKLSVPVNDYVLRVERVRGAGNDTIVVLESYFALDRNLPVDKELYYSSLYDMISQYCGIDWKHELFRYSDRFEAIKPDAALASKLEIKKSDPVLKRTSQTCEAGGRIFEYTICYYRADKYSCTIYYQ